MSKVCANCGTSVPENVSFCSNCGKPIPNDAQPAGNAPSEGNAQPQMYTPPQQGQPSPYGQPAQQPAPGYPGTPQPAFFQGYHMGPGGKMAWFKFIIYFQLFASAVLNVGNALTYFLGLHYDGNADMVYMVLPSFSVLDKVMGVLCLALAVFAILVRMRLAKFCANGPTLYYCCLGASIGLSILYTVIANILFSDLGTSLPVASVAGSVLSTVILLICNIVYFGKRKALFVNP